MRAQFCQILSPPLTGETNDISKSFLNPIIIRFRKKSSGLAESLGKMVRRADYDSYTELELHAELVYAECLLLKAMLTVCEDETLVSFVKAGLKVRQCYISFKCDNNRSFPSECLLIFCISEPVGRFWSTGTGQRRMINSGHISRAGSSSEWGHSTWSCPCCRPGSLSSSSSLASRGQG